MEEFTCPDHVEKSVPSEGWFTVEMWASGMIGVSGVYPKHPYCRPVPYPTREAAEEVNRQQKPMCMASGNISGEAYSREKNDLVIAHDVWDHAWLRKVLERPSIRGRMIYLLPDGMVENAQALFDAAREMMRTDSWVARRDNTET